MKNLIVYSLALVSLVFNLTGCGKPHELEDNKTCTLTTNGTSFTYAFKIFKDGIAESKCAVVAGSVTTLNGGGRHVFQPGNEGDRYNYFCVAIVGDNSVSSPYWTFYRSEDGRSATVKYSNGELADQTFGCTSDNH